MKLVDFRNLLNKNTVVKNCVLLLILIVAVYVRIIKLDSVPNGVYVDEAVIGYNAFSLLETGRDEYGMAFPVFLKSFNAYAAPLYTFITIPIIRILLLSVTAIRLPAAISGLVSVGLFYILISQLKLLEKEWIALLTTFLYAISPWSIFFSRGAYEANFAYLLIVLSIVILNKSLNHKRYFYLYTVILGVTTYAYQGQRLNVCLLLVLGLWIRLKEKRLNIIEAINSVVVFIAIQLPQLLLLMKPAFSSRASGLFYTDRLNDAAGKLKDFFPLIPSYILAFMREFLSQYVSYFSPRNLFFLGDYDLQRSVPGLSVFYPWMVIPYLVGITVLLTNLGKRNHRIIIGLLIIFAVTPALTRDPFSTIRALPLLIPMMAVIGIGLEKTASKINIYLTPVAVFLVISISLLSLWRGYFVLFPYQRAKYWGYGNEALVRIIQKNPQKHFVVDESRKKPFYIHYAFFAEYSPYDFQSIFKDTSLQEYYDATPLRSNYLLDNMETRQVDWKKDIYLPLVLVGDDYVISEQQMKEHYLTKIFEIRDPTGEIMYVGYETNPEIKCANNRNNVECR